MIYINDNYLNCYYIIMTKLTLSEFLDWKRFEIDGFIFLEPTISQLQTIQSILWESDNLDGIKKIFEILLVSDNYSDLVYKLEKMPVGSIKKFIKVVYKNLGLV